MFNVAIIKQNDFLINPKELGDKLTPNFIKEQIKEYIEIKEIFSTDEMMETVVLTIGLDDKLLGDTNTCYEDLDSIFQLCHLSMKTNGLDEDESKVNGISSYLVVGKQRIYGPTVLICSKIKEDGLCEQASFCLDDIVNIIYKKLKFTGIMVKSDGSENELQFYENPIEECFEGDMENYAYVEVPLCKFNLVMFYKKPSTGVDQVLNKKATKLYGYNKIYGDVILTELRTENEFSSLDIETYKKLLIVSGGSMKERIITQEESREGEEIERLPIVINRYRILENRVLKYKEKCYNCKEEIIDKSLVCAGCFRVKYDSKDCQLKHWNEHKIDCHYKKESLNMDYME